MSFSCNSNLREVYTNFDICQGTHWLPTSRLSQACPPPLATSTSTSTSRQARSTAYSRLSSTSPCLTFPPPLFFLALDTDPYSFAYAYAYEFTCMFATQRGNALGCFLTRPGRGAEDRSIQQGQDTELLHLSSTNLMALAGPRNIEKIRNVLNVTSARQRLNVAGRMGLPR